MFARTWKKQVEMAAAIGKDKSVISREIKRNRDQRSAVYRHHLANRTYDQRQKEKPKKRRFTLKDQQYVETMLNKDYSPDQIVGISIKKGIECVSHERIYQHIWEDKKRKGLLHSHLRRKGRKYRKRGSDKDNRGIIKHRVTIDLRPSVVDKSSRFGDLEVDLIIAQNNKNAILTSDDRASGMLKMKKVHENVGYTDDRNPKNIICLYFGCHQSSSVSSIALLSA